MANMTLKPRYQIINGVRCPEMFSPTCFKQAMNYKPAPEDVFIVSYPKSGTTWMQNVALYIFRKGKELEDRKDFFKMCPFIDELGVQGINLMPRPGALKTHLPYNDMPYSPDAKYIFVLRNPKDCCTSLFYHTKSYLGYGYWNGNFNDFFELFMAGEVEYDDYFDHLMSWYPHRKDSQIFYTTYEDMKSDTKSVVLKLASFLGQDYIESIERDNSVLNNILKFSGFEYMKKNISELFDDNSITDEEANGMLEGSKYLINFKNSLNPPATDKMEFVRKGKIGDWKNHFSDEMSERLNKKFVERLQGTEIYEKYKSYI